MKYTIKDFRKEYGTENKCLDALLKMRYGTRSECPSCKKETNWSRVKGRPCYQCQWCRHQISPMVGTVFASSHMPLTDWFYILYLMTMVTKHGISAKEVQRQLGCSYKTAWRNCDLLRQLLGMEKQPRGKMKSAQADEHYEGGKKKGTRGRGAKGKTAIFGLAEQKGEVRTFIVDDVKKSTLMPIMEENVEEDAEVVTDDFLSYNAVSQKFEHSVVKHGKKEFVNKEGKNTNQIENYWGVFKRSVKSTHIHVSKKHMQKYLDEFSFRYTHRSTPHALFHLALAKLVA